ncbi:MAG: DUF1116 domain-containing protein [Conexivisphaerales archaeon]
MSQQRGSIKDEVENANNEAVTRMMEADPKWNGVEIASRAVPGMKENMLLHAGPPITWDKASGPLRGALIGACLLEGWAGNEDEATKLLSSGKILIEPCHHHNSVGPMAGVISPSMPVYQVEDAKYNVKAFSNFNEGIGKVLRYGAYDRDVLNRLRWLSTTFFDVISATLKEILKEKKDGISFKSIISQALTMGDDCHNRYNAATSLFFREVVPYMIQAQIDKKDMLQVISFMNSNNFLTLNLGMATAKAMTLAAHGIKYSTIVTTMARNGTETGIRVSGLGEQWFTAPAPMVKGLWFPGYSEKDSNPDIGDSAITETAGFGGFAMAAAPAIISWVGGTYEAAVEMTEKMYNITYTTHRYFTIPAMNFRGTPTGIDIRKVVKTGITPHINTGVAHRQAGIGQIGAGLVVMPIEMFKKALSFYGQAYL